MLGTNRIAQTSRENPVESLHDIDVNWNHHGANDYQYSPLLDNGISLISIYQRRGNRHTYSADSSGQVSVDPRREVRAPIEDAMESHCGRTILGFLGVGF